MFAQQDVVPSGDQDQAATEAADSGASWEASWRKPAAAPIPAGAAPSTEGAAPDEPAADAVNWQEQYQLAQSTAQKLQDDLNRMKSNYDRQRYLADQNYRREREAMESRMSELEMRDLDDAGRAEYLQARETQRMERTASELDEREWRLQQRESSLAWGDFFVSRLGVDPQALRYDGEFEEFHSSGWAAVEALVSNLRAQNAQMAAALQAKGLPVPTTPGGRGTLQVGKVPPRVETKVAGPAPAKRRMADIPIAERERLYAAYERGDIRAEDMPV